MSDSDVTDVMTAPVMTVEADETLSEVGWAMQEKDIKSLTVIDEDCDPIGIVTSTDFVQLAADDQSPTEATVSDYMTDDVVTLSPETPVQTAVTELLSGGFNHAPVVDDGVIGMVSTTDLLESFVE
jgi:signal-transduction protein with cAMP-binding, CBS, and nucleotidyltransferase domain